MSERASEQGRKWEGRKEGRKVEIKGSKSAGGGDERDICMRCTHRATMDSYIRT